MKRKRSEAHDESLQSLILNFHNVVSKGPLYTCSCCDQLWYKHSVNSAATLRKTNPGMQTNLIHKISVDNVEWLCRSRHNCLVKNNLCCHKWDDAIPSKNYIFLSE